MPITFAQAKNAKRTDQQYKLTDSGGMFLLIHPNGSKYWRMNYRYGGKQKTLSLGVFPTVSILEAREHRDEAKKLLRAGEDPGLTKARSKTNKVMVSGNTLAALTDEYFQTYSAKWNKDQRLRLIRRMELHVLPTLGKLPIGTIKRHDILQIMRVMEEAKKWHQARRVLRVISWVLEFAVMTDRAEYNAAIGVSRLLVPYKPKHYPTLKQSEIAQFCRDLKGASASAMLVDMIRLLMLTMVRQQELRYAHWEDIDFKNKTWNVRPETTKTKQPHLVPLTPEALKILGRVKEQTGCYKLIFPSTVGKREKPISENTINAIIKRMGYDKKLVGHGFRAMASTVLNEAGFRSDVIEKLLAHVEKNQVRRAYNRAEYLDERREILTWWANHLVEAGI